MALTVPTTIKVPRQICAPGAEIVWTNPADDAGLYHLGLLHNTLYDQHRGALVVDSQWNSESTIIGTGTSDNLRYRCRLWGSGSLTETIVVGVRAYGNGGAGAGTITVSDGTNSTTINAPTGSTGTIFAATSTMTVIDNAEYADLSFTYSTATWGTVVAVFAYYQRARSSLPSTTAQYYTGTTFCPANTSIMADNFPVTSAFAYQLRDNTVELYARTGQAVSGSWGYSPVTSSSSVGFAVPVPEGVTAMKLYIDGYYVVGASGVGGYTVTTTNETFSGSFGTSRAWTTVTMDVTGLGLVEVEVTPTDSGGGSLGKIAGISAYWGTRALP